MRVAAGYADRIGLAFRIVDDVLDVTATEEQMGKSVGSDAGHNKNTFLSFCTVEQAIAEAEQLSREAAELLAGYPGAERLRARLSSLPTGKAEAPHGLERKHSCVFFQALLDNFPLVCAGVGWFTAQFMKVFTGIFPAENLQCGRAAVRYGRYAVLAYGGGLRADGRLRDVLRAGFPGVCRVPPVYRGGHAGRDRRSAGWQQARSSTASCVTCSRPPEPRT